MDWPVYFKEQLIIGQDTNPVAVCCLWTLKEIIARDLLESDFSVCGQLYSKEGIKYIVRNILANPWISFLIVCGADKSRSGEALFEAFHLRNFFDKNIPEQDLNNVFSHVKLIDMRGEEDSQKIKERAQYLQTKPLQWASPKVFQEKSESKDMIFPSDSSVFRLQHPTVESAWPWVLKHITRFGAIKETEYGMREKELLNLVVVITAEDPDNIKFADYFNFSQQDFENYAPQVLTAQPLDETGGLSYTYGMRLRDFQGVDQIKEGIIERLKKSIYSRRAIALTWQIEKDIKSAQPPCLVSVQALAQENKLYLTAYFRSNDMFAAWPQNALALRKMQDAIAKEVGITMGSLTTISCSAHIYEQDFEAAESIIKRYADSLKCEWDSRGNFVISLDKDKALIIVSHYSPEGLKIGEYQGKTARSVYLELDKSLAVSQIGHAFYLGRELTKAEIALKQNLRYYQDN